MGLREAYSFLLVLPLLPSLPDADERLKGLTLAEAGRFGGS
jgi:hypothetical protein